MKKCLIEGLAAAFVLLIFSWTPSLGARPVVSPEVSRFFSAVQSGNIEEARIALHNTNVNVQAPDGTSALHIAVSAKHREMVRFLLEQGASCELRDKVNTVPLHRTAQTNDVESARLLIEAGTPVDVKGFTSRDGSAQSTTLILAAEMGSLELVEFLVKEGANINYVNNFERTALFWARKAGKDRVAQYLVSQGATDDINEAMHLSGKFEEEKAAREKGRAEDSAKALTEATKSAQDDGTKVTLASVPSSPKSDVKELMKQARTLQKEGKNSEACEALYKVIRVKPRYTKARVLLCLTYLAMGRRKAAVKQYKIVKKQNPKVARRLKSKFKRKQ